MMYTCGADTFLPKDKENKKTFVLMKNMNRNLADGFFQHPPSYYHPRDVDFYIQDQTTLSLGVG